MFEGKHIHFSPTDNKPLCSFSGKLCRQRRLNGYAFCIRHILEDKSAPFKQCSYVTRNNSQKCLNAIPTNQDRGYCHSHMQVAGIIPKTERKPKHPPANKIDISNGFHSAEKLPSPSLSNGNIKKDPGAVFKFEEDSSDIHDVFPYKNGLVGTLNGKGKSCKSRDNSTSYNASKDIKNVKTQYGTTKNLTPNITTKKITDKNKNVYTAVVVPTTGSCVNSNSSGNKVSNSKSKTTCWSNAAAPAASEANPIASVVTTKSSNIVTKVHSSELNILHDSEDIRQFEQLKTLKQLDKSLQSSEINPKDGSGGEDAKSQVFPRLTLPRIKSNAVSSQSSERKSEIASTSPPPPTPLISRSNNSIIIKTESQIAPLVKLEIKKDNDDEVDGDKSVNIEKQRTNHSDHFLLSPSGSNDSSNQSSIGSNDHCSSIDKDLKNRHEFLAHVRHSFKSQYKSLRKACKFSEKYEQNGKQKLRDSLVRCVRIDTSICAQVLLGYGLKLPPLYTPIKIEVETKNENGRKQEFDDYDFVDNESAFPINKINTATATSEQKSKKGKISSIIGGKPNKSSSSSKPTNLRSGKKGKEVDQEESNSNPGQSDGGDKKGRGKGQQDLVTKESKSKSSSSTLASGKRKLKRADAISVSSENSLGSGGERLNESVVSLNNNNADNSDGIKKKKQKMDLNEMSALENELGLSLNDQSSPDERISSSAHHQTLTQGSGVHAIGELHDILENSQLSSSASSHRNQGLETVLNSVGSSENAGTPDGVITDASFDSTFEHSTSSQPDCEFSEDDLENSFELQIDPEIESQASRLLEDNVLTEADFTELFPDNRMSDHKFGRNDLQELGMTGLEFDVNDIDYSLFANIFPNFPRGSQPESISISNQF